ncbi:MAG: hypothetical protein IPL62_20665 [Caulobacteraceae bacterium]|nr:hypothetical protein [Caulobacteraceae bacterium]
MMTIFLAAFFVMLGFRAGASALRGADFVQARFPGRVRSVALGRVQRHRLGGGAPARLGSGLGHASSFLAFVASVSITFVSTLPATFTLDAGGVLSVLLFGATVLALAWFAPILSSEVVQ